MREEMWAHHEPRGAQYMGLNWVGPAIMAFGTEEQRRRHLPAIAAMSSGARGSASLRPGRTSPLCRPSPARPRRLAGHRAEGLDVLCTAGQLVLPRCADQRLGRPPRWHQHLPAAHGQPGDRGPADREHARPHHLNEVFLDDVWVERDHLLGQEGDGWVVINASLAHERIGIARYARADRLLAGALDRMGGRSLGVAGWARCAVRPVAGGDAGSPAACLRRPRRAIPRPGRPGAGLGCPRGDDRQRASGRRTAGRGRRSRVPRRAG